MALSANTSYEMRDIERISTIEMKVLTSSVVYNGALCSHDTTVGAIKPYDGTSADKLVGWHFGDSVTGNTAASVPPTAAIKVGGFVRLGAGRSPGLHSDGDQLQIRKHVEIGFKTTERCESCRFFRRRKAGMSSV